MTSPYISFFDADTTPTLEDLGGKCSSLATMTAAGMPVPPGFAVTTAGFNRFMEHTGLAEKIATMLVEVDTEDVTEVERIAADIREQLCSVEAPDDLRDAIRGAYAELQSRFSHESPVAVRSSATAEDLPGASFAGQQDTYLWITGADVVREHIRKCWASLYTSRAILYRLKNNITDDGLAMAVAVQKMVNSRVAGVAITLNPTTGDRSKIAIDSSWGVGEMVVSGTVTPDNLLLDKIMLQVVEEKIGAKHAELVPDPAGGALVEREVPQERREVRSLTDEEVVRIAAMAKRAEKHYGCPQDIEWALDADLPSGEDLLLLQSRPETVHSVSPEPASQANSTEAPATPASPGFPSSGFSMASMTSTLMGSRGA